MPAALHAARFALWRLAVRARLRRHGMAVRIEAADPPHAYALPRLEIAGAGRGGSLVVRLGRHVRLGRALVLEVEPGADSVLDAGDGVRFGAYGRVQLLGGTILLGRHADVRDLVLLKARAPLTVGAHAVLSRGVHVHATAGVRIGAHAGIGERTTIIDSDHAADGSATPHLEQPLRLEPIAIGANVNVGANAVVLRGARIGDHAVVAAASVVTAGDHDGGWLHAGAPATPRRSLAPAGKPASAEYGSTPMVRVFHCDDSTPFRALLRAQLEDDDRLTVVGDAGDLDTAVRAVAEVRPDIVLLDLLDVDRDAVGELEAVAPGVRVVVLSGHPREYGERLRGSAAAYVEKDAPLEELRDVVLRAAAG